VKLSITGLQRALENNQRRIEAMQPRGALGKAVQWGLLTALRYVLQIIHVDTGALRASQRMRLSGLRGTIYIDPAAVNPRGHRPADYGPIEHARGGSHAFYARTDAERGEEIVGGMIRIWARGTLESVR